MNIIKLNAIDSTNSFLLRMAEKEVLSSYLVVQANYQSMGRGQRDNTWESKPGENLMFSMFYKGLKENSHALSLINWAVSDALFNCLETLNLQDLSIKWPNDIMSADKKICGILIETKFSSQGLKYAVIGVGVNVNQESFSNNTKASSLKSITGANFDLDQLLGKLIEAIEFNLKQLSGDTSVELWQAKINKNLFKINKVAMFQEPGKPPFVGMIQGVNQKNQLLIRKEDESVHTFNHKEVIFL
ncbi:MAG: biotin--[acetyl-CoA-carboxylase] ligase [Flavobacteriaceae bacterium]